MHKPAQQPKQQNCRIAFHQGKALRHLADTYPTLAGVILELVQNGLDRDVAANRIYILVDFKTRRVMYTDNGKGISMDDFQRVLTTIADPSRSKELGRVLGRFAIGLMSPLGKCERYTFVSCPQPHKALFNEWMFNCSAIEGEASNISVPMRSRPELTLDDAPNRSQQRVTWRTKIELTNFSKDSYISRIDMDELVTDIQNRFSAVMRCNKTIISLRIVNENGTVVERPNVQARQFHGDRLPEYKAHHEKAGAVSIQLFVSPQIKGSRRGEVVMGSFSTDYTFPFRYFARGASKFLREEIITALSSGCFEGTITASKVTLLKSRDAFDKDEACYGLYEVIDDWYDQVGKKYVSEIKQSRQDQRYQELGLRSLKFLENLLKAANFANLLAVLKGFKFGLTGAGHNEPKKGSVVETQDGKSLSTDGQPGQPRKPGPNKEPRERNKPDKEKEEKIHPTATGPRGQNRRVVKNASFGLQFTYDDPNLLGCSKLWDLDGECGILAFNVRHPLWEACEKRDATLMKLQEYIALQALTLRTMPETFRDRQREVLDELVPGFVYWLLNADKVRGKSPSTEA